MGVRPGPDANPDKVDVLICPHCSDSFTVYKSQRPKSRLNYCSVQCKVEASRRDATVTQADIDRFWAKVDVRDPDECWPWMGSTAKGYGKIGWPGFAAPIPAPRVAYFVAHGRLPNHFALHSCDNPICVNPAHIEDGTQSANMKAAVARGRLSPPRAPYPSRESSTTSP